MTKRTKSDNGNEIRKLRRRLKLSQEQLAQKLGISCVTVSRWERGVAKPSPLARRLIEQLEVTHD